MTATTTPSKGQVTPSAPVRRVTEQDAAAARRTIATLERVSRLVTRALLVIGCGALVFTCVNVTLFAILHDVPWWVAWMLDPLASIALLTVLYVDGILAEQGTYKPSGWPFVLRWFAGLSTWLMNCWTSIYGHTFALVPQHPDAGGILLHSVAPMLLITLAEASAGYRTYLAERLAAQRKVIATLDDQVTEARQQREREQAAQREREQNERREREQSAENERREHERQQREIELAQQQRRAEIEALRETARIENERAQNEEASARRRAEIEAQQVRTRAEIEADERDREAARQAQIIAAQAEAKALEARTRAELAEREERRREAAERRQRGRHAAPEMALAKSSGVASGSAPVLPPVLAAIASENGGRIPREARERFREEAEQHAAYCLANGEPVDTAELAKRYGKGETWAGDRVREARRRLAEEPGFISEALDAGAATLSSVSA